jgi:hypothetical protein
MIRSPRRLCEAVTRTPVNAGGFFNEGGSTAAEHDGRGVDFRFFFAILKLAT